MSTKGALRQSLLTARRAANADTPDASQCEALLALPEIAAATVVAAYAALPGEPDPGPALAILQRRGVCVLLPVTLPGRDLEFRDAAGTLVELGAADVVVVPALACDRRGQRLGRGGGSYDRALPRRRDNALAIALVHVEELLDAVPVEDHDVRVDAVLAGAELVRVTS